MLAIGLVLVLLLGGLIAAVAGGGGDGDSAKGTKVRLEPIAARGPGPFTPDLSPDVTETATPSTVIPPPPGQGPFGGTGDNTLCNKETLVAFLTDPANARQASEWARVLGISVADIPDYVRDLVATTLTRDTQVTNHNFVNGRAVGYPAVLQAGTAVLVDTYGKVVARCRCGNPLLEPKKIPNPTYVGPRWPGFDPTVIVIIIPQTTVIFPPGGGIEATDWTVTYSSEGSNIAGSTDSTTRVTWDGSFTVDGDTVSGTGQGTATFNGGCFNQGTGAKISDLDVSGSFSIAISGTASGDPPNRTYALTFSTTTFSVDSVDVTAGSLGDDCRAQAQGLADFVADAFGPASLAAQDGSTDVTNGEFSGTYDLRANR
ncbi:MAG TPA: DUF6777 domain-containing protein [Acidimicrobiia bacterium]|nr:DUF6777 domain-containing protein [Acidimicrobiia bacterium]